MSEKEFIFEKTVYMGNVNMFGNVYFARYFEWQGEAREALFQKAVPESLMLFKKGIKIITIEASIKFNKELVIFDEVSINVRAENFKAVTFDLIFTYINKKSNEVIALGKQRIGFIDSKNKIIPVPKELIEGWERFKTK